MKKWKLFEIEEGQLLIENNAEREAEDERFVIRFTRPFAGFTGAIKMGFDTEESMNEFFEKADWKLAYQMYLEVEGWNSIIS